MLNSTRVAFRGALAGLVAGVALLGAVVPAARAFTTADKPASILVWPRIKVDTLGRFNNGIPLDTLVQLTNAKSVQRQAYCFYVNANSHCLNNPSLVCETPADCPVEAGFSPCVPGWSEIDFVINITQNQPLGWYASDGLSRGDFPLEGPGLCTTPPGRPCTRNSDCGFPNGVCQLGQTNLGSGIPPVPEDPFIGSLKCIQYNPDTNPPVPDQSANRDALVGHATILTSPTIVEDGAPDAAKYNAVGVRATGVAVANETLNLGGPSATANYAACTTTLILDHLFDFATDPAQAGATAPAGTVLSNLTLVPCGDNFLTQTPGRVTAQFLIFNEYEQRFSTSRLIDCFYDSQLSLIDTRSPTRSIFSAFVAGTIAGQTRIRGVGTAATGRGLIGVATLQTDQPTGPSAGYSLQQQGDPVNTPADVITLP